MLEARGRSVQFESTYNPKVAQICLFRTSVTTWLHPIWNIQLNLNDVADFSRGTEGTLPAIAQDHTTGEVLMLAWMNRQSLQATIDEGYAVYYSRSRQSLWRKGETSGHRQKVFEIRVDCDRDAILLRVQQVTAACHEGYKSCFFRRVTEEGELEIVEQRLVDPKDVYGE